MTWLVVKTSFKKLWLWLKVNWQIPFLLAWTIVVYVLTRRNTDSLLEVIEAKRDSYERQLEILKNTHNDEILKRNNLDKKYDMILKELEEEFKEKNKIMTEKQKNDIKDVIIKSRENPDDIKKRIEEEFGFRFVK